MSEESSVGPTDAALLLASDGLVQGVNQTAQALLGVEENEAVGQPWQRILAADAPSRALLTGLLQSGLRIAVPPLLVRTTAGKETLLAGCVLPGKKEPQHASWLLLWPATSEEIVSDTAPVAGDTDTVAVVAVDQLHYGPRWGLAETVNLLWRVHDQLREIIRGQDAVLNVSGAAVSVVLRDVDQDTAGDMSRAILSHLYGAIPELVDARLCVGLATCRQAEGTLAALVAASRSASLAQWDGAHESIREATHSDHELLLAQLVGAAALLSVPASGRARDRTDEDAAGMQPDEVITSPPLAPIETNIEGYVVDNMEGAVDQALFLARLDVPVGVVGPAGTGKMYIAKVIHEEAGAGSESLVAIDCREFRGRLSANKRIASELARGEGKTLVFKSPHLMHIEAQQKLAKQITTRTLADASPPRYLPSMKFIALFPESLELLVRRGELAPALASAFAAYPIQVPPIRDRKQAVLRWAHKILGQEGAQRDRRMKGFTPDAERAMLVYNWPGNISEMRLCIHDALDKTDKDWLTPVDLGLYEGIEPEGLPQEPETRAFLALVEEADAAQATYEPTTTENLDVALGEAIHDMLALELIKPVGTWLEDDLVLAALDRYRHDVPKAAAFLHTTARNIRRWLPKIQAREEERASSSLWQKPRRLLRDWVRETVPPESSPLTTLHDRLMQHLQRQGGGLSSAKRASVMGVSTPTFLKRLRDLQDNES